MKPKIMTLASAIALATTLNLSVISTTTYASTTDKKNTITSEISDSLITANVKAKFTIAKLLNPLDISVSTHHGIVDLKGQVDSETEYEKAVELAQSIKGVKDVNTDKLTVKGSTKSPTKDALITVKIKGKLMQESIFSDKDIKSLGITVETVDGVVQLSGTVDSPEQKANILKVAQSVSGVKSIESDLKIKNQ